MDVSFTELRMPICEPKAISFTHPTPKIKKALIGRFYIGGEGAIYEQYEPTLLWV